MKPFIRVSIAGGCVIDVESNLPGTQVMIFDMDAERTGDDPRTTTLATFPPEGMEVPNTARLTEDEIDRFEREMEGDMDGSVTTQAVLLHIISDSPQAVVNFRNWLAEAERQTRNSDRAGDGEFGLTFYSEKGSVFHTAFCFDTEAEALEIANLVFLMGNPDVLTPLGISWDPLGAWDQPITFASLETEDEDVKQIPRPKEEA